MIIEYRNTVDSYVSYHILVFIYKTDKTDCQNEIKKKKLQFEFSNRSHPDKILCNYIANEILQCPQIINDSPLKNVFYISIV